MYVYYTWISMSVTVNPSFSRLSLTLSRNLPNRPVSPSSSCSSSLCSSSSLLPSSSFTLLLLLLSLGCGQYSSHFWNKCRRRVQDKSGVEKRKTGGREEESCLLTSLFSLSLVTMTMMLLLSCHTMSQKSSTVCSIGPWVAM